MTVMCDPPSGWMYGFPKAIDQNVGNSREDFHQWLINNGYPKELIESFGDHFYCRFWNDEDEE